MYKFKMELSDDSPDNLKSGDNNTTVRFVLVVSDYAMRFEPVSQDAVIRPKQPEEEVEELTLTFRDWIKYSPPAARPAEIKVG